MRPCWQPILSGPSRRGAACVAAARRDVSSSSRTHTTISLSFIYLRTHTYVYTYTHTHTATQPLVDLPVASRRAASTDCAVFSTPASRSTCGPACVVRDDARARYVRENRGCQTTTHAMSNAHGRRKCEKVK